MNTQIQLQIEHMYSKKYQVDIVRADLEQMDDWVDIQLKATQIYQEWRALDHPFEKLERLKMLDNIDVYELIDTVITQCILHADEPLISLVGRCANILSLSDAVDKYQTIAEIISILTDVGLYGFHQTYPHTPVIVKSYIELDESTVEHLNNLMYLPPMVCKPRKLRKNDDSPWLTVSSNAILGSRHNRHSDEICLDVLNIQNQNAYLLDSEMVAIAPEQEYLEGAEKVYELMGDGVFYIPNQYDFRGRIYSAGYHINPQGDDYRKSLINLAETCFIELP